MFLLVLAYPGSPRQKSLNVCVFVCVRVSIYSNIAMSACCYLLLLIGKNLLLDSHMNYIFLLIHYYQNRRAWKIVLLQTGQY